MLKARPKLRPRFAQPVKCGYFTLKLLQNTTFKLYAIIQMLAIICKDILMLLRLFSYGNI